MECPVLDRTQKKTLCLSFVSWEWNHILILSFQWTRCNCCPNPWSVDSLLHHLYYSCLCFQFKTCVIMKRKKTLAHIEIMKYWYLLESNGAMLNVLSQHSERIWFEFWLMLIIKLNFWQTQIQWSKHSTQHNGAELKNFSESLWHLWTLSLTMISLFTLSKVNFDKLKVRISKNTLSQRSLILDLSCVSKGFRCLRNWPKYHTGVKTYILQETT